MHQVLLHERNMPLKCAFCRQIVERKKRATGGTVTDPSIAPHGPAALFAALMRGHALALDVNPMEDHTDATVFVLWEDASVLVFDPRDTPYKVTHRHAWLTNVPSASMTRDTFVRTYHPESARFLFMHLSGPPPPSCAPRDIPEEVTVQSSSAGAAWTGPRII